MTTWAPPIRHPWFDPPSMKRKLFTDDDDDADDASFSPDTPPASRRKRVRYDSLERTLAHMTLDNALTATSEDVDMWPKISLPRPHGTEALNVVLPSSVEEPGRVTCESVEDDMEVEPTMVTIDASTTKTPPTLDGSGGMALGQLDIKEVQISPAVLDCLRRRTRCPPAPIPMPVQTSQALVLYRTPRPPSLEPQRRTRPSFLVAHEDDVMEVE